MKSNWHKNRLALLLTGFLVLAIPLWFFNNLLKRAIERSQESSLGLLRESLLQSAEQVRSRLKPSGYIAESIREIHQELLPAVTADVAQLKPDVDFGRDEFSPALPGKLLKSLRLHGLDAVFILVNPPEFTDAYYWMSEGLLQQCPVPEKLIMEESLVNCHTANMLYQQHYQKPWHKLTSKSPYLIKALQSRQEIYSFAYLSRFVEIQGNHDRVEEYFTDYFGQQSLFYYSYSCVSSVNIHGVYTVIIPQKSLNPLKMLHKAIKLSTSEFSADLVDLDSQKNGFSMIPGGLEFYLKPPPEFWNHYLFITGDRRQADKSRTGGLHIRITGHLPQSLQQQCHQYELFRFASALSLILFFTGAFRYWIFGINISVSIRKKLIGIIGLIVFLPILGVGLLTIIALRGADRIIENQLLQQTVNCIKEVAMLNDENLLRQMISALEIKRILENTERGERDFARLLAKSAGDFSWYGTWVYATAITFADGYQVQYDRYLNTSNIHRLINTLLNKYLEKLGLEKVKKNGPASDFSQTATLGMIENYMTPEMEEAWMIHESTVQREITHTSDVSRAVFYLVRNKSGDYMIVYQRVNNSDEDINGYLSHFNNNNPSWFTRKGKYGDVVIGLRLRRYSELGSCIWPANVLKTNGIQADFERAMSSKDMGQSIVRREQNIEVHTWRYKEGQTLVMAAVGISKGSTEAGLATSMVFPVFLGYSVLLLFFISGIFAEFIHGPIKIFNQGIEQLSSEKYGIMISSFSGDEFDKVTRAFNEMSNALFQREMIKRYVSKKLIQQVQTSNETLSDQVGQVVQATVLASDIRGFTAISEKYSPVEVVEMLNSYFTSMEEAINEFGGIIDKYIGDAVQAVFYHDSGSENAAIRACRAAIRMRKNLNDLNMDRAGKGLFTIANGIGIDSGMVISGSIGSESGRKDFTVVGRIIEQAAALEALTPGCASKILVSHETCRLAGPAILTRAFNEDAMELADD